MKLATLIFTLVFMFSFREVKAQDERTKIYFLADTIDVPKNQRILEIRRGPWFVGVYEFYMKSYPTDNINLIFTYEEPRPEMQAKIVETLPNHHYRSWKSLFELLTSPDKPFDDNYQLYITEKLPGGRYTTHKVYRIMPNRSFHGGTIKQ